MSMFRYLLMVAVIASPLVNSNALALDSDESTYPVRLVASPKETTHRIDPRLFGHFLERPSWERENGPESALIPNTREVRPDVLALMRELRIPVIRFPGGTDVDYQDWTGLIDGAPGRAESGRPVFTGRQGESVTQEFGFDEFFTLADELGAEAMVVVNLLDGLAGRKPLSEAAEHAAALVAYCNAPLENKLPAKLAEWPLLRSKNGHPKPFGARYVQLGNELWTGDYKKEIAAFLGHEDAEKHAEWAVKVLRAYVSAIRAVDSRVEFLVDGVMWMGIDEKVLSDPELKQHVKYATFHLYALFGTRGLWKNGQRLQTSQTTPVQWWWTLIAAGGDTDHEDGQARLAQEAERRAKAVRLGYKIAFTEWNYGTWWRMPESERPELSLRNASGVGLAGFLHALMRAPDAALATQSMLVGRSWDIAGIRAGNMDVPAYFLPQAQVMRLYNNHRGDQLLSVQVLGNPMVAVEESLHERSAADAKPRNVAALDVLCTLSDKGEVHLHLINRDPVRTAVVQPLPEDFPGAGHGDATLRTLAFGLAEWSPGSVQEKTVRVSLKENIPLPPRSVNVLSLLPAR